MDCTPQQFAVVEQFLEVRSQIIQARPPNVRCIDGIVGIHDEVLGKVLIIITKEGVGICTSKGCQEVGPEFLEKYRLILQRNSV